jgi:ribosomal protein S18 acetylase RimI-like enzyme
MIWTIRRINVANAECIIPLLEQVQAIHAEAHPDHFFAKLHRKEVVSFLHDWLSHKEVTELVALNPEGTVLGYLIFDVEMRKASALTPAQVRGMLHHVAVDQACRRVGIGSALLGEMKARLRNQGVVRVRTVYAAFNSPSAALMRKAGMEPFSIIAEGST